jgi:uncharacterized protein YndB with AHSA1/START domain
MMRTTLLCLLVGILMPVVCAVRANAQEPLHALEPIEISGVVPAPIEKVWQAFTTKEGLESWMVHQAEVDLRNGGLWKTKYGKEGHLGDEGTIINEVLAYDPGRMLVLRIHTPPKGFPFMKTYRDMWTVLYFDPVAGGKTKVTVRAHGFKDEAESKQLRTFFEAGNKQTLESLVKHFEKPALKLEEPFVAHAMEVKDDGTLLVKRQARKGAPARQNRVGSSVKRNSRVY